MQGYKLYQEKLFSIINLRAMIPNNYLLITINKQIDFSFIYELTKNLYCNDDATTGSKHECTVLLERK